MLETLIPDVRNFASDNCAGVHNKVMDALISVNSGHTPSYGYDPVTQKADKLFKRGFGLHSEAFFVYNGTGANTVALQAALRPYEAVICASTAHINTDECGAPEKHTSSKLIHIPVADGKLSPDIISEYIDDEIIEHHVIPRIISVTQSTELGTLYSLEELKAICDYAHNNNMFVHVDGARFFNACAALNCEPGELTSKTGIDILSLGGTKNGLMFGEAVVILNPDLNNAIKFIRKQTTQLHSKMRFISSQFIALFEDGLWYKNAFHANSMARLLAENISGIDGVKITNKVNVNVVFAVIPERKLSKLTECYSFYIWDKKSNEVRLMTSFDTTEEDIYDFANTLKTI
ncbi:low specificity L-threonine aldolase [Marinilabiliaceae bacterium ANBcel2]|nr:low specificity L-threonine aldolase [Marinilabiliaceae bacterium ANBcel2]